MNLTDKAPFNKDDVVRYITGPLGGEERTVSYCKFVDNQWEVHLTNGFFAWSDELKLLSPAPSIFRVDVWPMGYCDNGNGHYGEHPLYTSSDNGCKNFVSSERLLEIKQLFDAEEVNEDNSREIERLANEIINMQEDNEYLKRDMCNQIADHLMEIAPEWRTVGGDLAIQSMGDDIRTFYLSEYYKEGKDNNE